MAREEQRIILSFRDEARWGKPDELRAQLLDPVLELAWRNNINCESETLPMFGAVLLRCDTSRDRANELLVQLRGDARFAKIRAMWDFPILEIRDDDEPAEVCRPSPARDRDGGPTGANVGIAMINVDTVDAQRFIGDRVRRRSPATIKGPAVERFAGHATSVAALLGGKTENGKTSGFATSCSIDAYQASYAWEVTEIIGDVLTQQRARIICAPVGTPDSDPSDGVDEIHPLEQAILLARGHNILFFTSAGDSRAKVMLPPASIRAAITIGGVSSTFKRGSPFIDNRKPDFWTDMGSFQTGLRDELGCFNGTSASVPLIVGAVATWYETFDDLSAEEVLAMLMSLSIDFTVDQSLRESGRMIPMEHLAKVPRRPEKPVTPSSEYAEKLVKATKSYLDKARASTLRD